MVAHHDLVDIVDDHNTCDLMEMSMIFIGPILEKLLSKSCTVAGDVSPQAECTDVLNHPELL